MKGRIAIEAIEVYGYHGVYSIEHSQGNRYQVDLYLTADIGSAAQTDDLSKTVDYAAVYAEVIQIMEQPVHLLETLTAKIGERILEQFSGVEAATVRVRKFKPISMEQCEQTYVEATIER